MKVVFFDLGDTLESNDVLLPGALDTLREIQALRSPNEEPPILGLISDFDIDRVSAFRREGNSGRRPSNSLD